MNCYSNGGQFRVQKSLLWGDFEGWAKWREETTIGSNQWKSVGFEVNDVPRLPLDIDRVLNSDCPYFDDKKVYQTHKLMLIPKGLSLNIQDKLMRHLNEQSSRSLFFGGLDFNTLRDIGDRKVPESYWALVTTDLIPESRDKFYSEQQKLMKEGYELPSPLETTVLVTMHKEFSGQNEQFLLPHYPQLTFTRCKKTEDYQSVFIGQFTQSGLLLHNKGQAWPSVGALALRKL